MTAMGIATAFFYLPTAITNPAHLPPFIIATIRFETPSFPNGNRGQGLSSEPAFAGSSDGNKGTRRRDEAIGAQLQLSWGPDDRASSLSAAIARAVVILDMVSGCVCCLSRVTHTLSGYYCLCSPSRASSHVLCGGRASSSSSSFPAMR
jgi:hypothetical protein